MKQMLYKNIILIFLFFACIPVQINEPVEFTNSAFENNHSHSSTDFTTFDLSDRNTNTTSSNFTSSGDNFSDDENSSGSGSTTEIYISSCGKSNGHCNIFVSSIVTTPNIGIDLLDKFCEDLAFIAGIEGKYHALIKGEKGFWEFTDYKGLFTSPSGIPLVIGISNLSKSLPINENEFGWKVSEKTKVFTGYDSLFLTCPFGINPWSSNDKDQNVNIGYVEGTEKTWYNVGQIKCSESARIYCVEIPKN